MSARTERAFLLYNQSRYDLAEKELRLGLADDPHDPTLHALLALCLAQQKQFMEAGEAADAAVGAGPDQPFTHYARAWVFFMRNRFAEAEETIAEAIRLDPSDSQFYSLLASVKANREDWPGALAAADEGLLHNPEHSGCVNMRAQALVHLGRKEEASRTLEGSLARDPENAFTHASRGWSLLHEQRPRDALTHFQESLRLDPELDYARQGMIEALKARYWIYRQMLRVFLWMIRLSPQARWGVIIGLFLLQRFTAATAKANPELKPILDPLLIGYLLFVVMTWLAIPLSNLLLRLNRFGRLALSADQKSQSSWVGLALLIAIGGLVYGMNFIDPYEEFGEDLACMFVLLTLPLSTIFVCSQGWPRRVMILYTLGMLALTVIGISLRASAFQGLADRTLTIGQALERYENGFTYLQINIYAALASSFLANWLMTVRPKL